MKKFQIDRLKASIEGKEILKGVSLEIEQGEVHVIMGPNGSGKSTLAQALMGHPGYEVDGEVLIDGKNMLEMSPDERAKSGLFLAFQYPTSISGVSVQKFLWSAYKAVNPKTKMSVLDFRKELKKTAKSLGIDASLLPRSLNEGFSGGEKKRVEMLQMLMLKPKYSVLDEVDSGLDVDAIKAVAKGIKIGVKEEKIGVILITHYQRILKYLDIDKVHVVVKGEVVNSGGKELVERVEKSGYEGISK